MRTIFSARDIHPRDRLSHWYSIANKVYVGHHCSVDKSVAFDAAIEVAQLADVDVSVLQSSRVRFTRSRKDIAAAYATESFLCVQLEGHSIWRQDGRDDTAGPGDVILVDAQRPYELAFCDSVRLLTFKIPQRSIEQRIGPTIGLTAIPVRGNDGLGAIASGFLRLLPDRLPLQNVDARIADHALDLAAMALLAATTKARPAVSSAKAVALACLRSAIDQHLGDPDLDTEAVARSAGISVRYASQLLSEQGTSIHRHILDSRLEQCRRLLADPSQAHRSITEIALSWGFSDASHFGRRFKRAFGAAPRDYRAGALRH